MIPILITQSIKDKLKDKHGVCEAEIHQCFQNKVGIYLIDDREDNRTDPCTLWFIAETNRSRLLKVVFMFIDGNIHIKSAFEPNNGDIKTYEQDGK